MTIKNEVVVFYSDGSKTSISDAWHVPIKKIGGVVFEKKKHNVWLYLKLKNGEKAIIYEGYSVEKMNSTEILLMNSVQEDNMQERLKKAFKNLITFYGGNSKEPY